MPIYEYRCSACEHRLEAFQKMSDAPLTDCPECGKAALNKLISPVGFRLKGGGWYETDFKTDKRKNLAETGEAKDKSGKDGAKDKSDGKEADAKDKKSGGAKADKPKTTGKSEAKSATG